MGLITLRGTEASEFVRTCIPRKDEIKVADVLGDYKVQVMPQYMGMLGSMCDYGVRSYYPTRDYAYLELGMIMEGVDDWVDFLVSQFHLSAEQAYYLCSYRDLKEPVSLNSSVERDYDNLVHRAVELFSCFNLNNPCFGKYYTVTGCVKSFECDCVDNRMVLDMKVSLNVKRLKEYWTQVLLYSILADMSDGIARTTIGLVLPVQGKIMWFTYPKDQYVSMIKEFKRLYVQD